MKLKESFISFRNSEFPDKQIAVLMNRRQNLVSTVETLLSKVDSGDKHAIEDFFDRSRNRKRNIYRILKEFDRYLKKNNMDGVPFLPEKTFYDSDAEIKFEILKLIHKPMKASEIGEALSMDADSVNKHINALKEGYSFMGTEIKVNIQMDRWQKYCIANTHPLFLALNSTELNHLMTYLQESNDKAIQEVGELIYTQMTQYAREIICPNVKSFKETFLEYHDEYDHASTDAVGYLMKSVMAGHPETFSFHFFGSEGNLIRKTGKIINQNLKEGTVEIITKQGEHLILKESEIVVDTPIEDLYR